MKIAAMLGFYMREHVRSECVTWREIEVITDRLEEFFGHLDSTEVTRTMQREYAIWRGVSTATYRKELNVLRAAAKYCRFFRMVTEEDMPRLDIYRLQMRKPSWLYPDELHRLFNAAGSEDNRIFLKTLYYTGGRRHAVERLQMYQIDLKSRLIDLSWPLDPITKKNKPIVPIDPELLPDLEIACSLKKNGIWLFGNHTNRLAEFQAAAKRVGLGELATRGARTTCRLTPHMMRHSRATHLLQAGCDPYAVAELLGDTPPTVLRVYGHHCPSNTGARLGFKYKTVEDNPAFA